MRRHLWISIIMLSVIGISIELAFAQAVRIMPLGDSITRGERSTNINGYRLALSDLLANARIEFDFVGTLSDGTISDKDHEGNGGWTTGQLLDAIGKFLSDQTPEVIFLHIGTNDLGNNVPINETVSNLQSIIDRIDNFNPGIEIYLATLIPRKDLQNADNDVLNGRIEDLVNTNRSNGRNIFLVDQNTAFTSNPNWKTQYMSDSVHPNDAGYDVMGQTWYDVFSANSFYVATSVFSDNFDRSSIGSDWVTHPDFAIKGKELSNTGTFADWYDSSNKGYIALATKATNAISVSFRWGASVTNDGISTSGIALMFDSPSTTGNGYMINKHISKGLLRLWEVKNGAVQLPEVASVPYKVNNAGPGDEFRVDISTDNNGHRFACYVNDQLDGTLVDSDKRQGNAGTLYSGVILHGNFGTANDIDDFVMRQPADNTPPAAIIDLAISAVTTSTVELTWTAPGDDGDQGTAATYNIGYATSPITNTSEFNAATPVSGIIPTPAAAGTPQNMIVTGLSPNTTYYFAIRAADDAGNGSDLSNSPSAITEASSSAGNFILDDFNRANLGSNWVADPGFQIVNNELANTSTAETVWDLAIYAARKNPVEISFQWGAGATAEGIGQGGFAVMLDSPTMNANGYLVWWRTATREIRLWTIVNGSPSQEVARRSSNLPDPKAGDVVKVVPVSDASGHYFTLYINDVLDGTVSDPNKLQGNADALYAGVMLTSNLDNKVDNFTIGTAPGKPATLSIVSGDGQSGVKGTRLPNPFVVALQDEDGGGAPDQRITFTVTQGGGTMDKQQTTDANIRIEAESGALVSPMIVRNDGEASDGKYVVTPNGTPEEDGGSVSYSVDIQTAGNYVIWGRVRALSSTENSFWVSVDAQPDVTWHLDENSGWGWDAVAEGVGGGTQIFSLSVGTHTLVVKRRETNAQLDKLLITSDLSYVPSGLEQLQGYYTGNNGTVSAFLTLGPTPGTNKVTASFPNLAPVTFTVTALTGPADRIVKTGGDNQLGTTPPGQPLPAPFVVTVTDKDGIPIPGHSVTFVVTEGGGTLSNKQPVLTNANGQASTTLTLGTTQATNKVEARAFQNSIPLNGSPAVFTATALPGNPAKLVEIAGNQQTGSAGQPLPTPLQVRVTDQIGSFIANHLVTFKITAGGGNIGGQTNVTASTNAQGIAQVTWTLGNVAGATNRLEASSSFSGSPLQGSPITFTATAAVPTSIQLVSGDAQQGTISSPLDKPFVVLVKDASGKALGGQRVTFTVTEGNGKLGTANSIDVFSDASGQASATLTLGPTPGATNRVRATSTHNGNALVGSPITFTAIAAGLKQIVLVSGNNQTGIVNAALSQPIKAMVLDMRDRGVPNWPVQFTVTGGGGKFEGSKTSVSVNTGTDGTAQATWTLGPSAGLNNNVATASTTFNNQPLTGSPLQLNASAIASAPARLKIAGGDSQSTVVGNEVPNPLKAQVTDANGNGIANHEVIFAIKAGGGSLNGSSSQNETRRTDANGFAQVTLKVGLSSGLLNNEVEARASYNGQPLNGSPAIFKATATSSEARNMALVGGDNQTGTAGRRLPQPLRVKITDKIGNPVIGHPVTFSVAKGGGALDTAATITAVKLTNDNGVASADWYLGPVAGKPNEMRAVANDGAQNLSGAPMIFNASSVAGPMDANASTIVATSPVPADGATKTEITITLTDAFGNPIPNKAVLITVSDTRDVPEQPQVPTDEKGQVKAYLKSTRAGWKSISARNINDGIKLKKDGWVKFTALAAQTMAYQSGNEQTGNIGTMLVKPLEILVTDKNGNPAPEGKVNFRVSSGGGQILEPQPVVSDTNGIARANWVLGPQAGSNALQVDASLAGSPVNYSATGVQSVPDKLMMISGDEQNGPAGLPLRDSVVVKITDAEGRPIWNHPVAFVVIFDGQKTKNDTTAVVRTNFAGEAKSAWTLGTKVGLNFLEGRAAGLKGSPVTFRANGATGLAYGIQIFGGNDQNVAVATLSKFLVTQVVDQFKNPVEGKEVKFRILHGDGASLTKTAVVSNASGNAGTQLQLGKSIGEYVVEATAENLFGSPLIFRINGVAAAAKEMKIQSGNNQLGTINRELPLPLEVLVVDANNNPKSGVPVNFVVSKGGGKLDETKTSVTINTGSNGIAQATWKIGSSTVQNGNEVTAINGDIPGSPLVFRATGVSNNNFPQFDTMPLSYTMRERDVLEFPVTATDDDGDPLSYSTVKKPAGSSFGLSGGKYKFKWTPAYDQAGLHQAIFKVEDGKGGLDQVTVNITVKNFNQPPVVKPRPANLDTAVTTNTLIKYSVEAADADSDSLYYLWTDSFFGPKTVVSNTKTYNLQTSATSDRNITAYVFDLMDTVKVTWHITITVSVELVSFSAHAGSFNGIRLQWQTANEAGNAGFNVLRSRFRDGEYKRINGSLLPARRDGQYSFEDTDVVVGVPYYYKIEDVDIRGIATQHGPVSATIKAPTRFTLSDNYPNPFNPETAIRFELPSSERVALIIYNSLGQEVRRLVDEQRSVGYHNVTWDGRNSAGRLVGSGIYFYRLVAGKFIETRKMTLLR